MEIQAVLPTGFLLRFPEGTVAVNPDDSARSSHATIVLNSLPIETPHWHGQFRAKEDEQQVFCSAGEYECRGMRFRGYGCDTTIDGTPMQTTFWLLWGGGVSVLILGAVADYERVQKVLSDVNAVDVLVMACPDESGMSLSASHLAGLAAAKQVKKLILSGSDKEVLQKDNKELGTPVHVGNKYTVKRKELAGEGLDVVILESQ